MSANIQEVEIIEEGMSDNEAQARAESDLLSSMTHEKSQSKFENVYDEYKYRQMLLTPDAKDTYNDIDRDMVGANLSQTDVIWVEMREKLLGQIQYLMNKGLELQTLKEHFKRSVYIKLNVSLSRDGYLRESMNTQGIRFIRGRDKEPKPPIPYGVRGRR